MSKRFVLGFWGVHKIMLGWEKARFRISATRPTWFRARGQISCTFRLDARTDFRANQLDRSSTQVVFRAQANLSTFCGRVWGKPSALWVGIRVLLHFQNDSGAISPDLQKKDLAHQARNLRSQTVSAGSATRASVRTRAVTMAVGAARPRPHSPPAVPTSCC